MEGEYTSAERLNKGGYLYIYKGDYILAFDKHVFVNQRDTSAI